MTLLADLNCEVDLVSNGEEAVEAVQEEDYHLILMDVQMPGMDGMEAARAIRKLPGRCAIIPIIAVTANAMKGDMEKYIECGMTSYVSKPIATEELFARILECCEGVLDDDALAQFAAGGGARAS